MGNAAGEAEQGYEQRSAIHDAPEVFLRQW
jgi:hypothetical protein